MVRGSDGLAMFESGDAAGWVWGDNGANDFIQCHLYPLSSVSPCVYGGDRVEAVAGLLLCDDEVAHGSHGFHGFEFTLYTAYARSMTRGLEARRMKASFIVISE